MLIKKDYLVRIKKETGILKKEFIEKTVEPREIEEDKYGLFIAVGKLKKPQHHFGKHDNGAIIWKVQLTDDLFIKVTETELKFN